MIPPPCADGVERWWMTAMALALIVVAMLWAIHWIHVAADRAEKGEE